MNDTVKFTPVYCKSLVLSDIRTNSSIQQSFPRQSAVQRMIYKMRDKLIHKFQGLGRLQVWRFDYRYVSDHETAKPRVLPMVRAYK